MIVEETEFETSISFYKYTLQNLTYKVKEEFLFQIIFKYRKKKRDKISKINYLRCAREYQFNPSGSFPETNSTPGQILKKNLSLQRTRPTDNPFRNVFHVSLDISNSRPRFNSTNEIPTNPPDHVGGLPTP